MHTSFFCQACGQKYRTTPKLAGKRVRCQTCRNIIEVPDPDRTRSGDDDLNEPLAQLMADASDARSSNTRRVRRKRRAGASPWLTHEGRAAIGFSIVGLLLMAPAAASHDGPAVLSFAALLGVAFALAAMIAWFNALADRPLAAVFSAATVLVVTSLLAYGPCLHIHRIVDDMARAPMPSTKLASEDARGANAPHAASGAPSESSSISGDGHARPPLLVVAPHEPAQSSDPVALWGLAIHPDDSDGTLSIQYRFDVGSPTPNKRYVLIIEASKNVANIDYTGRQLARRGTLQARLDQRFNEFRGQLTVLLGERPFAPRTDESARADDGAAEADPMEYKPISNTLSFEFDEQIGTRP